MNRSRAGFRCVALGAGLSLAACASLTPVAHLSADALQTRLRPGASDLSAYLLTDAVWVRDWRLLVNRDYDMSMALMIGGVGAGLAAAKRQEGNRELAERLDAWRPPDAQPVLAEVLRACGAPCHGRLDGPVALYGVLFGHPEARLQVVLEWDATNPAESVDAEPARRLIHVSAARPVAGEAEAWTARDGQPLRRAVLEGTSQVAHLFTVVTGDGGEGAGFGGPKDDASKQSVSCSVGGGAKHQGRRAGETAARVFIQLADNHRSVVSCPAEAVEPTRGDDADVTGPRH